MSTPLNPFCSLGQTRPPVPRAADGTAGRFPDPARDAGAAGPPVFHTVEEVARTLGVSPKTIRRRIKETIIRTVPMGGRLVRISSAELQRLAAGAPSGARAEGGEVSIS